MRDIAVPFRGGELVLTAGEAQRLMRDLAKQLGAAEFDDLSLDPPPVSNGLMNRGDFFAFFAQIYHTPSFLNMHASKLFQKVVWYGSHGHVAFRIVCQDCGEEVKRPFPKKGCTHPRDSVAVDVASLKEHGQHFLDTGYRYVAGSLAKDFEVLLKHLPS